jgi:phospholipase C
VPTPPANPNLPGQERGVRPARAIPYTLRSDGLAGTTSVSINVASMGGAAAVFQVRSADAAQAPRTYTVESGKQLTDSWDFTSGYDLSVHGPNGFFRRFKGGPQAGLVVHAVTGTGPTGRRSW